MLIINVQDEREEPCDICGSSENVREFEIDKDVFLPNIKNYESLVFLCEKQECMDYLELLAC